MAFRVCRLLLWTLLLLGLGGLLYLDRVGLPEVFRQPLVEQVRRHGLELEYARIRLHLFRGIVADEVAIRPLMAEIAPRLQARRVHLDLQTAALWQGRWELEGLEILQGRLAPLLPPAPPEERPWTVERLEARVRFLPEDTWNVEQFQAWIGPVRCSFTGTLTHASTLRTWPGIERRAAGASTPQPSWSWPAWTRWLEGLQFPVEPEVTIRFEADARRWEELRAEIRFTVPEAVTPWGTYRGCQGSLGILPGSHAPPVLRVVVAAQQAWTPWGDVEDLRLDFEAMRDSRDDAVWRVKGTLDTPNLHTRWASVEGGHGTVEAMLKPADRSLQRGSFAFSCERLDTGYLTAQEARLDAEVRARSEPETPEMSPGPWRAWTPWQGSATFEARVLAVGPVSVHDLRARGQWSAPVLQVPTFEGRLGSGAVAGGCTVDLGSNVARFEFASDADPFEVESYLSERARRWLAQFRWQEPPRVRAAGSLRLPHWPAGARVWAEALRTSLTMTGEVALAQGSFRGFTGQWARTHFQFSDGTWHFPDLEVNRSDGWIRADYRVRPWARDYHWRFVAALPPDACRPLLRSNQVAFLDLFSWTNVPGVEGEVWGRFLQPETVAGHGHLVWSNFSFRGVPIRLLDTELGFSNQWLHAVSPRVEREGAVLGAEGLAVDFRQARVHLTNAVCQDDPATVAAAIGPRTATNLAPYRFERPPRVWLNGTIPFRGTAGADLQAYVEGGPFRWWRFRSARVAGHVHWREDQVSLTNVTAEFYGGRLAGWGVFDTSPPEGTDCRLAVEVSQVRMPDLMQDLSPSPRRLEGVLDGRLEVTRANTRDWRTWNGQGEVRLRDGWIWSIPLFGILSEPLDALVPGLGRSPVTSGQATFILTNGVIVSDNLECRAATMRLLYNGRLSLVGEVDAVVQAELLRDAWLVGRVLSLALWPVSKILEFHVTGTLENPRAEPLHIPRVLTIPLRPVQTLRELLGPPGKESNP